MQYHSLSTRKTNGMRANINEPVWVKLTEEGKTVYNKHYTDLKLNPDDYPPKTNLAGYTQFQHWELMSIFGSAAYNGCTMPFDAEIHFSEPSI